MKNILITGGLGFIGTHMAMKLIAKGYKLTILDNLSEQVHGTDPMNTSASLSLLKDKVTFIRGSVTSIKDWTVAIKNQQIIIHLAAETGTGQSMYQIEKYIDVNIKGTGLVLDLLANSKHSIEQLVIASSRSIYGEGKYNSPEYGIVYPDARLAVDLDNSDFELKYKDSSPLTLMPTDEDSKIHPSSVYGITKQNQEQLVLTVSKALKIKGVALRYQNVYGPGQSLSNPYTGILSIFSTQIKNGNDINIFEDGLESRDFVFVEDVVDATILAMENNEAEGKVFNVGSGQPTNVLTVAKTLASAYKIAVNINITGNYRLGDIRHNYADLSLIKKTLGFTPKWSFEAGIKAFVNWVNKQEVEQDNYAESIKEMKDRGLYK